jgi:hypothetical protein
MSKKVRIRLDLKGEEAETFRSIQRQLGLKNSTEVVRFLIQKEAQERRLQEPELEHYNLNNDGVRILDRTINRIADLFFKPDGIWCDYCEENQCRHIIFALTVPVIQGVIRKRRRDGWKLPDV